jgi:hypothetical protein
MEMKQSGPARSLGALESSSFWVGKSAQKQNHSSARDAGRRTRHFLGCLDGRPFALIDLPKKGA